MRPIAAAPQYRRGCTYRKDNMIWGIVGKIRIAVSWRPSQGRVQCDPAYAGNVDIWPGVLNFSDGIRFLIQVQQSLQIARRYSLRPTKRHQQGGVFSAVSAHRPQRCLRSPIFTIESIDQLIADVIIKCPHLLANRIIATRQVTRQVYNLGIDGFDMKFGLDKNIRKLPLAYG